MAHGVLFHRLADRFVGWLCSQRPRGLSRSPLASFEQLWHALYDRFAAVELDQLLQRQALEEANRLSLCLKSFCQRLVDLRHRTPGFKTWQDLYLGQEYELKEVKFAHGVVLVSGRVDAVRTHPEYGVEVVDYKLSRGTQAKHDLVQLAIYARMLAQAKPGLRFHGVLEYYEPELLELPVTVQRLDAIFAEIVAPVLLQLTPAIPRTTNTHPDVKAPTTPIGQRKLMDGNALAHAIRDCYAAFKLDVEVLDCTEAPQLLRYRVRPEPGVRVVSLANRSEDLQVRLALAQPPLIAPAQGYVTIDIPKPNPDTVYWRDVMERVEYQGDPSPVAIPIGIGVDGRLVRADFADPNCCHALVAGTSGSGKSEFLKSLVAALIARNDPHIVKITIIDPKILTFGSLRDCAHLTGPIITDTQLALERLEEAVVEMDRRYQRLAQEGVENLNQRLSTGRRDIPFHVIVFDEFADLIAAGKEMKQRFEAVIARLAAKARAAGIHLVLTTQRPDRKVVTGLIKTNLPLKVCLRVTSAVDSQIVLDQTGGEALLGKGDLLCNGGRGPERAQSPYITQEELAKLIKATTLSARR